MFHLIRFLAYNSVGFVKTIEDSNIVVEFHDIDTHHSEFYNNTGNKSNEKTYRDIKIFIFFILTFDPAMKKFYSSH